MTTLGEGKRMTGMKFENTAISYSFSILTYFEYIYICLQNYLMALMWTLVDSTLSGQFQDKVIYVARIGLISLTNYSNFILNVTFP